MNNLNIVNRKMFISTRGILGLVLWGRSIITKG